MKTLIYILVFCLSAISVSADVDTIRVGTTPPLWDAYLDPFNPSTNFSSGTFHNVLDNGGGDLANMVVGVAGLDALIGSNTRDSVLFRIARNQAGDDGNMYLRGVWKYNFTETDPTWLDWDATALEWGTAGAKSTDAIATGTFNITDGGGDDVTTEFLDTTTGWNAGAGYFTGSNRFVDSTFFSITTLDTVWWQIWPAIASVDGYPTTSNHATFPLEIIIYSTATGGPADDISYVRRIKEGEGK